MENLRVAISACLMGKRVRYDGGHKLDQALATRISTRIELLPICPEYEAGLGVPREAMRLVGNPVRPRLWTVGAGRDVTGQLVEWCEDRAQEIAESKLCGVILKSRSPSCGLAMVDVFSAEGVALGEGPGLFVRALMGRAPRLPLVESGALQTSEAVDRFVTQVEEYAAGQ